MKYTYTADLLPGVRTVTLELEGGQLTGDSTLLAMYELDKGRQFSLLPTGPFMRLDANDPASVWAWLLAEYYPATCEPAPPLPAYEYIPNAIY